MVLIEAEEGADSLLEFSSAAAFTLEFVVGRDLFLKVAGARRLNFKLF